MKGLIFYKSYNNVNQVYFDVDHEYEQMNTTKNLRGKFRKATIIKKMFKKHFNMTLKCNLFIK